MTGPSEPLPPLTAGERRELDRQIDRIEDRLVGSEAGLHAGRPAASAEALAAAAAAGLSEAASVLWGRFDGMELGHGEARVYALSELQAHTQKLLDEGRAQPGDVAIGCYGRDDLVACADPWEEGAEVVLVDESGQRGPYGSSVPATVLGILGELSVLLDDSGEFHEELFGEDGELEPAVERKLLRRHLDMDADAPLARFRLAQLLRRGGEGRAARKEAEQCLRRAPEFAWAHFELGRACLVLDDPHAALDAFDDAAERAGDEQLGAYFNAWGALAASGERREVRAAKVVKVNPGFARAQEAGAREALEDEVFGRARELVELGLAVAPKDLGLLGLRRALPNA